MSEIKVTASRSADVVETCVAVETRGSDVALFVSVAIQSTLHEQCTGQSPPWRLQCRQRYRWVSWRASTYINSHVRHRQHAWTTWKQLIRMPDSSRPICCEHWLLADSRPGAVSMSHANQTVRQIDQCKHLNSTVNPSQLQSLQREMKAHIVTMCELFKLSWYAYISYSLTAG